MDEYNKALCDKVQKDFEEKFVVAFKKVDKLETRVNWFYILAIGTLVSVIANLVKEVVL